MRKLHVAECWLWTTLDGVEELHALEDLIVEYFSSLVDVRALGKLRAPALAKVELGCFQAFELPVLKRENLPALRELRL